jgi:heavy metal sensor kinase
MRRWPVRLRLAIWCAAAILSILTPSLVGVLVLEWRSMRAVLDHHLAEDLEVVAEMLAPAGTGIGWRTDSARDWGYDAAPQRWVEVYAPGGGALYFRGLPVRDDIRRTLPSPAGEPVGFHTRRTPAGARVRVYVADRLVGSRLVRIRVARSEDSLWHDLLNLFLLFSVLSPASALAAAGAAWLIAGRALAPLQIMAARAQSISAERLSERLPVESDDELGRLARIFNETFARLEASFARLTRFTADASHELRMPLTAIRSVGEVGLREAREPAQFQEIIGSMLEETDRLARMVDTLLTLSRWESGRVHPVTETVDLAAMAAQVAGQLAVLAEERDVTVELDCGSLYEVRADATMLRQAVTNVVDNAIKFTRPGTRVRISCRRIGARTGVTVDDEGPGIPAAERARVVERFYRMDRTDESGRPGAGLGLAIVHWALAANGGELTIEDNDAGGARVSLWLDSAAAP